MRPIRLGARSLCGLVWLACVLAAAIAPAQAQIRVRRPTPATNNSPAEPPTKANILFLHHSTGGCIWEGGVKDWFEDYNAKHKTHYAIHERNFPRETPYGWNNYPYDYWNIWVRHAGNKPYKTEPTLDMLAIKCDVIIFKHCFPVSAIEPDTGKPDIASDEKRVENYKLQYDALKKKMRRYTGTKFIVWTGAALVKSETDEAAAKRAKAFFAWVRDTWNEEGDNIFVWDFHTLETDGGLYLKDEYAQGDSHPNEMFSRKVAPLFCRRVVDVIRGNGDTGSITGGSISPTGEANSPTPTDKPVKPNKPTKPDKPASTDKPQPKEEPKADTKAKDKTRNAQPAAPHDSKDVLIFDNAEDASRCKTLWGSAATYMRDGKDNVIRIRFADGKEEDWGEYGRQRIIDTLPPKKNLDIAAQRYLTLRVKVDRPMELVLTLITRPDSLPRDDASYFGFTAYMHPKPGDWQWVVLDLTKLELGAEGDKAYAAAGKPTHPQQLTTLRLVTNEKNKEAAVAIDDVTFYRELPASLRSKLHGP